MFAAAETTWAIIGVAIITFFSTTLTILLNSRSARRATQQIATIQIEANDHTAELRRQEKEDEYARQDELSRRQEESARLIVQANQMTAKVAEATNVKLDEFGEVIIVTHALVNSDKTSALERERVLLIATRSALKGQKIFARMLIKASDLPDNDIEMAMADIDRQMPAIDARIIAIEKETQDRLNEQHIAEKKAEEKKATRIQGETEISGLVTLSPPGSLPQP